MWKTIKKYARKFLDMGVGSHGWITLAGRTLRKEEQNGFVDAALRAIINAACQGELQLRNADGSVIPYEKKGKNPLLDLMYQPSPAFNENIFKQICLAQLFFFGNVFILKDARDSQGRPTRLIPVPQPFVFPLFDLYGYPYAYKITTIDGSFTVPREDIIHVYRGNEIDLFWGHSQFLKCKIDSDIMNSAKVFNLSFFRNGANPGGIISYPNQVGDRERAELLAQFNDEHAGAEKAHRTVVLSKGGTYESFKTSHKDIEYKEGLEFHMQQILSMAGVPPAMVGLFRFAPQFNTKEQQKIFYENEIMPTMRLFADAFSEELVPEFIKDESVYVWYDFSKVKALEPDWNSLADAALKLSQKWPINEVRDVLGLPFKDVPGGDEPPSPIFSAFGLSAKPVNTIEAEPIEVKALSQKKTRVLRPSPAQMKRHKVQKAQLVEEQSKVMENSIDSHFKMQADLFKGWVSSNEDKLFDYNSCFGSKTTQEELLLTVKVPAMAQIFQAGIDFEQNYLQSLNPSKDFKFMEKKSMQDRVQYWAEVHALKWAESIEQTTFERIDRIIKLGTERGMSNSEINNIILQFFSEEGYEPSVLTPNDNGTNISIKDRVKTIVQTETLSTINESQLEAFKSTPFVNGKTWITTMGISDHHEGHLELDGQEVRIDDNFTNPVTGQTAQAPGQFGTADQDINCLCDMSPVIIDED